MSIHELTEGISLITSIPGKEVLLLGGDSTEEPDVGSFFLPLKDFAQVQFVGPDVEETEAPELIFFNHQSAGVRVLLNHNDYLEKYGPEYGSLLVKAFTQLALEFYSGKSLSSRDFQIVELKK